MFNKTYWKNLIKKQTILEWIIISIFAIGMTFFSIFDINGTIVLSSNWSANNPYSIVGQLLILISAFVAILVVMNRIHRLKQEMVFLLTCSLLTGLGLLMTGYANFGGKCSTGSMAPGVVQMFIFGMSALSGLSKYKDNGEDIVPAKKKLLSIELVIAILATLITIFPFYMLFDKLGSSTNAKGSGIKWVDWLGIIAFSLSTAAIICMVIFRWAWTFVFWTFANITFVIYYILLKTEINIPLLSLAAISGLFTVVDFYILLRWNYDQKNLKD